MKTHRPSWGQLHPAGVLPHWKWHSLSCSPTTPSIWFPSKTSSLSSQPWLVIWLWIWILYFVKKRLERPGNEFVTNPWNLWGCFSGRARSKPWVRALTWTGEVIWRCRRGLPLALYLNAGEGAAGLSSPPSLACTAELPNSQGRNSLSWCLPLQSRCLGWMGPTPSCLHTPAFHSLVATFHLLEAFVLESARGWECQVLSCWSRQAEGGSKRRRVCHGVSDDFYLCLHIAMPSIIWTVVLQKVFRQIELNDGFVFMWEILKST